MVGFGGFSGKAEVACLNLKKVLELQVIPRACGKKNTAKVPLWSQIVGWLSVRAGKGDAKQRY